MSGDSAEFGKFVKITLSAVILTQTLAIAASDSSSISNLFWGSSANPNNNTNNDYNNGGFFSNKHLLTKLAFYTIGLQWVVYIVHASGMVFGNKKTEKFYDLTGSCTFISSILLCFVAHGGMKSLSHRQRGISLIVLMWAVRLGLFLFARISNNNGIDDRFNRYMHVILGAFLYIYYIE